MARPHGLRRHLSLLVSGGLVLLIGVLGVGAGQLAGDQAREVHREDRAGLQRTLAGLVDTYLQLSGAEVQSHLARGAARLGPWDAAPGSLTNAERLRAVVEDTRALDVGAVLVDGLGAPLATYSPDAELPARDDPGWAPLRAALRDQEVPHLPVSGVLDGGGRPVLAMALPVPLVDGTSGLVLGIWSARGNGLQEYVSELTYGRTGHGYVVDGAGTVVAGPALQSVGAPLPLSGVREALHDGDGLLDTSEGGTRWVTSHAPAGRTGWTALTPQTAEEFEGALQRSSRTAQAAVVLLLVAAGTGLVVLHRKRESALQSVALRDELTGLYNRRGWFTLAEHELERARRHGTARVLLFIDVDGLKQVNDVLGHREGDRAIVDAARVLTAASRSSDLVGRLGGDEFVLMLGEEGDVDVARRRVVDALAVHNAGSGAAFELRLSLGAELWFPDSGCSLDELVRRADADMYVHKTSRPARHDGVVRLPEPRAADARVGC